MIEQRDFTTRELLAWCRFLSLTLAGASMAYVREREGSIDGLIASLEERLAAAFAGLSSGTVEASTLGLLLNVQALGAEVRSRVIGPEAGELVVAGLPGERLLADLDEEFSVALDQDALLSIAGVEQDDLNRLFDVFGAMAAAGGFEFSREEQADEQRLSLRVW